MALWTEPRSITDYNSSKSSGLDAEAFMKIRRFVVIRAKPRHCMCLLITTYSRQGTSKTRVSPHDHAPLVLAGQTVKWHANEGRLSKKPIHFKLEDTDVDINPMSRIDFSRIYTLEYTVKVRSVGRVVPEDLPYLEAYFRDVINVDEDFPTGASEEEEETEEDRGEAEDDEAEVDEAEDE
jgi:hypothetical protein